MRFAFTSLGCKLNHAEVQAYARQLRELGHTVVPSLDEADVHVVNTCTVTHAAARDSRKAARRGGRVGGVKTVLTGCYASDEASEAASLPGVDLVVDNLDKDDLVRRMVVGLGLPVAAPHPNPAVPATFELTRGMVKIEDGCDWHCAFCIIPSTRGEQRSRSPEDVLREVQLLCTAGYQEIVLGGVQISSYRSDGVRLTDLTRRVLDETRVKRLRLTSIAPWQFDRRLLALFEDDRLCPHFHLSLQAGCDATLGRMQRPYRTDTYRKLVDDIRRQVPGVAITTDVIVGFAGESESDFVTSLDYVRAIGFSGVHVFPFSRRPGTEAAAMATPDLPVDVLKDRVARMREVGRASQRAFWTSRLGQSASVLWERRRRGEWTGLTRDYLRVYAPVDSDRDLHNVVAPAVLSRVRDDGIGVVLTPPGATVG